MSPLLPSILTVAALIAPAIAADAWHTDFPAALTQAKAEKKPVLLVFTGSDWCGWCMTMRLQVLDTKPFYDYARDKFVLMEVDLPRNTSGMTPEQLRHNNALVSRYGVTMFPTVLVITPEGQVLGGFTGGRTDLASVAKSLDLAHTNAELLQQAANSQGIEKAQILKTLYGNIPDTFRRDMHDMRKEIAALDPQNTTGIHTELQDLATIRSITEQTRPMQNKEAADAIIAALPKVSDAHRGDLLQMLSDRLNAHVRQLWEQGDSLADIEEMRRTNLRIIEYCVPKESHKGALNRVNKEFAQPQKMLDKLRREREYRIKYKK
ncbi:MAG: thioredoxin family protein [Akkermansia sp.]|nr:thioredoxin family protein [Akkermansia sp.]